MNFFAWPPKILPAVCYNVVIVNSWKAMKVKSTQMRRLREKTSSAESVFGLESLRKFPPEPISWSAYGKRREIRFMHVTHQSACVSRNLGGTTEVFVPIGIEGYFFCSETSINIR